MKITGIEIGEYRQFKNITFDFTYPKGHLKEGQPLDKVCFIGQSGTGKTTLLNVIWDFFQIVSAGDHLIRTAEFVSSLTPFITFENELSIQLEFSNKRIAFSSESLQGGPVGSTFIRWANNNGIVEDIKTRGRFSLFIKDSIAREADAFLFNQKNQPQNFSDFIKTEIQIDKEKNIRDERIDLAGSKKVISLGDLQSLATWQYLLNDISKYDEASQDLFMNLMHKVEDSSLGKVLEELQNWKASTPNPRIDLAEKCLNPILKNFFLEVDSNIGSIPIALQTRQGVKIDSSYLSTGTRQLLATAIPLYKFDTTDTVILFDEPERSLFPDIQRILIDYYTSLAPEAQFFFATHSPIIASAFEPCERFILYFDENGEVKFHNGVAPEGDDPNDVLRADFGLDELMGEAGLAAYREYLDLVSEIKNESNMQRRMKLIAKRAALGNKYNFTTTVPDETK